MGTCASSEEMRVHDDKLPRQGAPAEPEPPRALPNKPPAKRGAVGAKTAFGRTEKVESVASLPKIAKDDALRRLILEAIQDNLLFRVPRPPTEWGYHPSRGSTIFMAAAAPPAQLAHDSLHCYVRT